MTRIRISLFAPFVARRVLVLIFLRERKNLFLEAGIAGIYIRGYDWSYRIFSHPESENEAGPNRVHLVINEIQDAKPCFVGW